MKEFSCKALENLDIPNPQCGEIPKPKGFFISKKIVFTKKGVLIQDVFYFNGKEVSEKRYYKELNKIK